MALIDGNIEKKCDLCKLNNLDINYYLYLFSLSSFTIFLFFINYLLIYNKKEKVVLQNEKEMV